MRWKQTFFLIPVSQSSLETQLVFLMQLMNSFCIQFIHSGDNSDPI